MQVELVVERRATVLLELLRDGLDGLARHVHHRIRSPSDLPRLSLSGPVPNPLTEEPEEPATTTVTVTLKQSGPLGISWSKCPSSTQWHGTAARVERIKPGSQAEAQRANGLEVGLRLASVNGDSVREMLFTHAVEMVRQARRPVTLELEQIAAQEPPSPLVESVANVMRVSEQLKTLGDDSCTPLRPPPEFNHHPPDSFFVVLSTCMLLKHVGL